MSKPEQTNQRLQAPPNQVPTDIVPTDIVPTIDLSDSPAKVGAEFDTAYSEVGFCQVVSHNLDPQIEQTAHQMAIEFFALPETQKRALTIRHGEAYGYGPFQAERLAASLGTTTPPDLKETFSIGPRQRPTGGTAGEAADFVYSPNRWPAALPELQVALEAHYDQLAELVGRIMSAMAVGLGLESNYFDPYIDKHTSALRALHYPALASSVDQSWQRGQLRAGAHADYGTITLLHQDKAPGGLEVLGMDGQWHPVTPIPGAYVVNVGDTLARWTNDRWRSTIHRVVLPPTQQGNEDLTNERFSMAFFHNANWDARIACLPTCLPRGSSPTYEPITAGQHLMEKFRSTQDYG